MDNRKSRYTSLILVFALLWVIGIIMILFFSGDLYDDMGNCVYGDAGDYWARGLSIWQNGRFSLLHMSGTRGYVYPLFCGSCNLAGGGIGFFILNSLLLSIWWLFFQPELHGKKSIDFCEKGFISIIICFLLFNLFFYGLSIYPLTDMFAIIICSFGILLLVKIEKECSWRKALVYAILTGCISYFTYNIRTIYLFTAIYFFIRFVIAIFKYSAVIWRKLIMVLGYILGVVLAALPQLYMNYKLLGILSIKVPTNGLMLKQLYWGLLYQRYDTYVLGSGAEHAAPMYFMDPVGSVLLAKEGITEFSGWSDFFMFIFKHPFDAIGIYMRHLVNMFFPCWPSQYVTDLDNNKIVIGVISYVCIFFFGIAVYNKFIKGQFFQNYIALLLPCIFILPGAVEIRFFAAVYIMIIGVLCYNVEWGNMKTYIIENKIKLLTLFLILGGLLLAIWTSMLASDSTYSMFMS